MSTIVYLDDHKQNLLLMERIVRADGHDFFAATNEAAATELLGRVDPDLLLVSDSLPSTTSPLAIITKWRTADHDHPTAAVLCTNNSNQDKLLAAQASGCHAVLCKPADIRQIQALLREQLSKLAQTLTPAPTTALVAAD